MVFQENKIRNASVDSIGIYKGQLQTNKITEEDFRAKVYAIKSFKDGLIVIIKADDNSRYGNLVDILDEMNICNIGRYAIVDITPIDLALLTKTTL